MYKCSSRSSGWTVARLCVCLKHQVRELQSELNEANNRAALTEQVLLRSAAAEAAEVGADIEGVTENVKLYVNTVELMKIWGSSI